MWDIKRILVVIDPTTPSFALERVAPLLHPLEAQLMLLICADDSYLDDSLEPAAVAAARKSLLSAHRKFLDDLAAPLKAQGLDVIVDVRRDRPLHDAIIRAAVEWGADLVVKDTQYQSALRRSIFSNTDWSLVRHCPMQLLMVNPRPIGAVPRLVAAVDPLHPRDKAATLDNRIVTCAKELAQAMGGETHLLHVCESTPLLLASPDVMVPPISVSIPENTAELVSSHAEAMRSLGERHGIARERVHMRTGATRQLLVEATDELGADVLIMGAVSRSAIERLFVGSTAEAVVDRLSCDVLIVKPAQFTS